MISYNNINKRIFVAQSSSIKTNSTIIDLDEGMIIIDTFLLPKDSKDLIKKLLLSKKKILAIINTHYHSDHCSGNRFFTEFTKTIISHKNYKNTYTKEKMYYKKKINNIFFTKPTIKIKDKIVFFNLLIFPTPGHSSDSISVYDPISKILITGDTVLNYHDDQFSIPFFAFGNINEHLKSLKKISKLNPKLIIPGHGNPMTTKNIKLGIEYLTNLKKFFFTEKDKNISLKSCIKNTNLKLWNQQLHDMNLKNLNKRM